MDSWYILLAGKAVGPFTLDELRKMSAANQIVAETVLRREGEAAWMQAAMVTEVWSPAAARTRTESS